MNKALAIMHMYPDARPLSDFKVLDYAGVQTIIEWNIDAPEPTEEELQQAWEEYLKQPLPEPEKPLEQQIAEMESDLGNLLLESATDKATISSLEDTVGNLLLEIAALKGGAA